MWHDSDLDQVRLIGQLETLSPIAGWCWPFSNPGRHRLRYRDVADGNGVPSSIDLVTQPVTDIQITVTGEAESRFASAPGLIAVGGPYPISAETSFARSATVEYEPPLAVPAPRPPD